MHLPLSCIFPFHAETSFSDSKLQVPIGAIGALQKIRVFAAQAIAAAVKAIGDVCRRVARAAEAHRAGSVARGRAAVIFLFGTRGT